MVDSVHLPDTPKRKSLQSQADTLRAALKDYERVFAADHNGRKPSRDEIKANAVAAAKYQQYQIIRDVLAGKCSLEALKTPRRQQTTRRRHERTDSAISLTPHQSRKTSTPPKRHVHPNNIDPYDPPSSASPIVLPNAIGPTPHRDGTVLGIFDLLSNSGSRKSSQATPSSKKRRIDALYETAGDAESGHTAIAQTPSQKRRLSTNNVNGDVLGTTPRSSIATGKRNHSKTPISEGKKFMLNHFFATPSAVRFAGMIGGEDDTNPAAQSKTPLRDLVLGVSPAKGKGNEIQASHNADATPPYLKRSFSFKERLLSASGEPKSSSTSARRSLSGSLRQSKFAPKPLSQIIADMQQAKEQERKQQQREKDDNDDDLDALREMEASEVNVLVEDSQIMSDPSEATQNAESGQEQPVRVWKKKGQKRTTRRVMMRPVKVKPAAAPRFVADEEDEDEDQREYELSGNEDGDVSRVEETRLIDTPVSGEASLEDSDLESLYDEFQQDHTHDEDEFQPGEAQSLSSSKRGPKNKSKAKSYSTARSKQSQDPDKPLGRAPKVKKATAKDASDRGETNTRKINPNAHSHLNFRSLKIKNKNSKAKGRGGLGRGGDEDKYCGRWILLFGSRVDMTDSRCENVGIDADVHLQKWKFGRLRGSPLSETRLRTRF